MAEPVRTFDPSKCQITVGGAPLSGYASGTFVSIDQDDDSFTAKVGCDGEVARAKRPGRTATMKVTLMATSLSNVTMSGLAKSGVVFPVLVKEGGSIVFSSEAWIQKPAAFERGEDVSDTEWTIRLATSSLTHGGNP